jgi:hypothetical protein
VLKLFTRFPLEDHSKLFSFLPPYSRTCIENISIAISNSSFPESLQSIASDLEKAQPNLFLRCREYGPSFKRKNIGEDSQKKIEYATKNTCRK